MAGYGWQDAAALLLAALALGYVLSRFRPRRRRGPDVPLSALRRGRKGRQPPASGESCPRGGCH